MVAVGRGSSKPRVLARGFKTPLGLAWSGSTLFVAAQGSVSRLAVTGSGSSRRRTIVERLPFGRHQQDTIVLGPDGRLYLGSGTTCDVCREKDRRSRAILSFKPDGAIWDRSDRAPQPVRARLRRRHALRVRQRPRRPRRDRAGRDDRADQAGRRLRLAALLGKLAAAQAAGLVPRRHAAGRVPRAALLGELTRALGRNDDRGRVGPVPERALGPEARPGERPDRPLVDLRRRLRPPVGPCRRAKSAASSRATGAVA